MGQLTVLLPSPPPPCWFNSIVFHASVTVLLFFLDPHARRGRRIRDGLRPLPPTPKKEQLATQLSSPCGIPRRFSFVPPENLATQLSSPWLHPARFSCVLVSAPLPDDGFSPLPRQPVLSISLTFTPLNPQVCVLGSLSGPFRQRHHHHGRSPRPRRLVFATSFILHQ